MPITDHGEIVVLADAYLNAVHAGDAGKLAALFDPNAQVYGQIDGQPYFKSAADYVKGVAARKSPMALGEAFGMEVLAIDSLGGIASVKLHSPMLGFNYHLYLTLRRLGGRWLIVNKTFHHNS